jgi:arabinose-5-phosphate isomerase
MNKADPQPDRGAEADFARQVLRIEADAVAAVTIDEQFHQAVDLVLAAVEGHGSIVVSGLGKNSYIAQKLSATFASTGTPSHFLHPTEAMHGDLGRIRRGDVVVALSFGGNTDEMITLASVLQQDQVSVIAIVGNAQSDLARLASVALCVGPLDEACPHNLAPTASTTAMLALGDALALAVSRRRAFGVDDFKKVHPGGNLGRQLTPVVDAMRFKAGENLPLIGEHVSIEQAYAQQEQLAQASGLRRAGALLIVDDAGRLIGIFTDGDLRRSLIRDGSDAWHESIGSLMTRSPLALGAESLIRDAVQLVREYRIDEIPVADADGKPLGLIDVQDLVALKVIEG